MSTCKFAEIARALNNGTEDYHGFKFLGIHNLMTRAKQIQEYYLNTTLDSANLNALVSETSAYSGLMTTMRVNANKVYNDPAVYYGLQVPDVNSSNVFHVSYLTVRRPVTRPGDRRRTSTTRLACGQLRREVYGTATFP